MKRFILTILCTLVLIATTYSAVLMDDDTDYLTCGGDSSLTFGDVDFTLIAWAKFTALDDDQALIHKGNNGSGGERYSLTVTSSGIQCQYDDNSNKTQSDRAVSMSTDTVYLVACTWDSSGNVMKVFLDGVQIGTDESGSTGGSNQNGRALLLGAQGSSGGYPASPFLDGTLIEAAVLVETLTAAQQLGVYTSINKRTILYVGTDIRGYWILDDHDPESAANTKTFIDYSGNGNTCTAVNGTVKGDEYLSTPS